MDHPGGFQFQGGGALLPNAYYLTRSADEELFQGLCRSSICSVIAPRQMGKSSLRTRTEKRLREAKIAYATVDLRNVSTKDVTAASWYRGVAKTIARGLGIAPGFDGFWGSNVKVPAEHWVAFLHDYIPEHVTQQTVIFLDETDSVLSLPFKVDDFFAAIRGIYNARADDERLARLTFCLLGVFSTGDLLDDPNRTPFNVGELIRLADFTEDEVEPLASGLQEAGGDPERLLAEVVRWTSGHPYMTQRLCEKLVLRRLKQEAETEPIGTEAERVATLVHELFLERGQDSDENLDYAAKRLHGRPRSAEMLALYSRVRRGERVPVRGKGSVEEELWLTGMVAEMRDGGDVCFRVRNRIFEDVFDEVWIKEQEAKRELSEPLGRWQQQGRHPDYLLHGAALEKALAWAHGRELTREENEFLREGLALQTRKTRQRQWLAVAIAAMLGVLGILGAIVFSAYQNKYLIASNKELQAEKTKLHNELGTVRQDLERIIAEKKQAEAEKEKEVAAAVSAKEDSAKAKSETLKLREEWDKVLALKATAEQERKDALREKDRAVTDYNRLVKDNEFSRKEIELLKSQLAGSQLLDAQVKGLQATNKRLEDALARCQAPQAPAAP